MSDLTERLEAAAGNRPPTTWCGGCYNSFSGPWCDNCDQWPCVCEDEESTGAAAGGAE